MAHLIFFMSNYLLEHCWNNLFLKVDLLGQCDDIEIYLHLKIFKPTCFRSKSIQKESSRQNSLFNYLEIPMASLYNNFLFETRKRAGRNFSSFFFFRNKLLEIKRLKIRKQKLFSEGRIMSWYKKLLFSWIKKGLGQR